MDKDIRDLVKMIGSAQHILMKKIAIHFKSSDNLSREKFVDLVNLAHHEMEESNGL